VLPPELREAGNTLGVESAADAIVAVNSANSVCVFDVGLQVVHGVLARFRLGPAEAGFKKRRGRESERRSGCNSIVADIDVAIRIAARGAWHGRRLKGVQF